MITRKELSLKIIGAVDLFFKDSRSYDLTIFFWNEKKSNIFDLNLKFTAKVFEQEFIIASSAYQFIENKNFKTNFLGFENNIDLSKCLSYLLSESSYQLSELEFSINFSIVNGVTFHHENWITTLKNLLGYDMVEEYIAINRYNHLSKILDEKKDLNKKTKI